MTFRRGESGNVFFTLFGAVALVGVIGVATSSLMRGPVGTVVSLNQRAKVESQLQIARKLVALHSAQTIADCDGDGTIEPAAPNLAGDCATLIPGGGCLPTGVGAAKTDPWGTMIGYCGWNHDTMGGNFVQANACGASNQPLLVGENGTSDRTVLAVISAGPDRQFQTTCGDHPAYVNKPGTSDDIVFEWTYDEAAEGLGGGLWSLVSGGADRITTSKDLEIGSNATFASGSQSTYQGGASASFRSGSMLDFTGGGLFKLPDQTTSGICNGANESMLRVKTDGGGQVLQICDPGVPGWVDIGGSGSTSAVTGANGDIQFRSGDGLGASNNLNWNGSSLRIGNPGTTNDTLEIAGTLGVSGILTAEDEIQVGAGSAADPSYSFIGNETSGLYNDSGNVGISVAGNERLLADTNGVDINGTLYVDGDANINDILYVSGTSTLIDGSLDVRGNIFNGTTGTVDVTINDSLTVTGNADFNSPVTMDNTLEVTGTAAAGFFAVDGTGGNDGLNTNGSGGLVLQTNGNTRLEIDSAGDVGIGLAGQPTARLDVGGSIRLRDIGAEEGLDCTGLNGSISYDPDNDEFLVCSNLTTRWETVGTSGGGGGGVGGLWERVGSLVRPIAGHGVDDFVFGATQLNGSGTRFFYDKSLGAFRAGVVGADQWDENNRGAASAAFGRDTIADGDASFAAGDGSEATGNTAIALGETVEARAPNSIALGQDALVYASANNAMVIGLGAASGTVPQVSSANSLGIFMGDQSNVDLDWPNVMLLAGGSLVIDPDATSAVNITPDNGLAIDVEGNVGAINFCDQDGLFCFTPEDIATGSTGAPGNEREIIFHSGGALDTYPYFVFSSTGQLGIGTTTPAARLHIAERAGETGDLFSATDSDTGRRVVIDERGILNIVTDPLHGSGIMLSIEGESHPRLAIASTGTIAWGGGSAGLDTVLFRSAEHQLSTGPHDTLFVDEGLAINTGELSDGTGAGGRQLRLDVEGAAGATFYCNEEGEDCFTAADISGNSFSGDERGVVFNSGNTLMTDPNFIFSSAGGLGIGNIDPLASLHVGPTLVTLGGTSPDVMFTSSGQPSMMLVHAGDDASLIGLSEDDYFTFAAEDTQSGIQFRVNGDFETDFLNTADTAMRIMSSGQVGINVADPQTRLDVDGTLKIAYGSEACDADHVGGIQYSSNTFYVCRTPGSWEVLATGTPAAAAPDRGIQFNSGGQFDANADFTYTADGRVVIGTDDAALDSSIALAITGSNRDFALLSSGPNALNSSDIRFYRNKSGADVEYDDRLGDFRFLGMANGDYEYGAVITATVDGTPGAGNMPTRLDFNVRPDGESSFSNSHIEMALTSDGNLGIGTTTPASRLHIYNDSDAAAISIEGDESQISGLGLYTSGDGETVLGTDSNSTGWLFESKGNSWGTPDQANDFFLTYWDGSQWLERLFIEHDTGAVGIGNNNFDPATLLDVDGTLRIADGGESCTADTLGAIRFNAGTFYVCRVAGGWDVLATGTPTAAMPERGIQFRSNGDFTATSDLLYSAAGDLILSNGNMSIAAGADPVTRLDVGGTLRIADGGEDCDGTTLGAIRYDAVDETFYVCQAAGSWTELGAGVETAFTALTDTPTYYSNSGLKWVRVTEAEDGLEFTDEIIESVSGEPAPTGWALAELSDVNVGGVAPGEVLLYSGGQWIAGTADSAASSFTDLTDTPAVYSSAGQFVRINAAADGLEFTDQVIEVVEGVDPPNAMLLSSLGDVSIGTPDDGQILLYSAGAGAWVASEADAGAAAFTDLSDTPAVYGSAGQFIRINATEDGLEFTNQIIESYTGGAAPTGMTLSGLSDVDLTGVLDGEVLLYSGGTWIPGEGGSGEDALWLQGDDQDIYYNSGTPRVGIGNDAPATALDVTGIVKISEGIQLGLTGGAAAPSYLNLGDLGDVDLTGTDDGEVLLYSAGAGAWVPGVGAGGLFTDLGDTPGAYTSAGHFVRVNSSADGLEFTDQIIEEIEGQPAPNALSLSGLGDVDVDGVTDGQVLLYSAGASAWVPGTGGGGGGKWLDGVTPDTIYYDDSVGINIADPAVALDIDGDIQYTGTITDVSDMRLKTDIVPLEKHGSMLDRLQQIETYSYRMKADEAGRIEFGVMAQELEAIFPELVRTADNEMGTKSVNYVGLIAPMIKASQELQAENEILRTEIAALRAERDVMQTALNDLATDVKGLKAHTGYGIGRAELSLWIIFAAIGSGMLVLLCGGIVRNRHRSAE